MEKINIIVPILNKNFDLKNSQKLLSKWMENKSSEKLLFEAIFVASSEFEKPKNFRKRKNFVFSESKEVNKNALIEEGFSYIKEGASLILDEQFEKRFEIIDKILLKATTDNIVRVKPEIKKGKVKVFFEKIAKRIYSFYLKLFNLGEDLFCYNGYQYFNSKATHLLKTMPESNAYLRNYDALIGYELIVLKTKLIKEKLFFENCFSIIVCFSSFVLGVLFLASTIILTNFILSIVNGFLVYILLLFVSFMLVMLSSLSLVKATLFKRANL